MINVSRFGWWAFPIFLFACAAGGSCGPAAQPAAPEPASQVESDVVFLASAALGGRKAGTDGSRRAAVFLATRYANLGMPGAFQSRCPDPNPCPDAYFQPFSWADSRGHNVGARVPGADSARRGTWIVIGAHFDNSGRSDHASFAKENIPAMHLYTGYHWDYHKSTDVASRIDFAGLERVIDFVERLAYVADQR